MSKKVGVKVVEEVLHESDEVHGQKKSGEEKAGQKLDNFQKKSIFGVRARRRTKLRFSRSNKPRRRRRFFGAAAVCGRAGSARRRRRRNSTVYFFGELAKK